jgi:hypothetical protein
VSDRVKAPAHPSITATSAFDALYRAVNKPSATPQATVEAIVVAVRERGLAALKDAANVERLAHCDQAARAQINRHSAADGA